jgi:hypothetical protein
MVIILYQADGRVAAPGDHAMVEADILGPLQSVRGENRAYLGRPVLVAGAGGEPPEWAGEVDWEAVEVVAETGELSSSNGVSPLMVENPAETGFSPQNPARSPLPSG